MKEMLRNALLSNLAGAMDADQMRLVSSAFDNACSGYSIIKESTDLIVKDDSLIRAARDFIAVRKTEGVADGTLKNYWLLLKIFCDTIGKNLSDISITDVRLWCYNYKTNRNVSDRTMNRLEGQIKSFFSWMCDEGYIAKDVLRSMKRVKYQKKQKQALCQMDLERLLNSAKEDKRSYSILMLMYATGCRVSEIVSIKLSDIRQSAGEITVIGKGRKQRTVFFEGRAAIALNDWISARDGKGTDWLYPGNGGNHLCTHVVLEIVHKYARISGCPADTTPHTLRHTTATIALERGCPVQDVQRMLGHSNISTTMIYAQVNDNSVKASHRKCVV